MQLESWLTGIIRKRPECALLCLAMIRHGIKYGKVSAENTHHIPVSHENCRGAATRLLSNFGFVKDSLIKGTTKKSHGHWLWEWRLNEPEKAISIQEKMNRLVCNVQTKQNRQMELL